LTKSAGTRPAMIFPAEGPVCIGPLPGRAGRPHEDLARGPREPQNSANDLVFDKPVRKFHSANTSPNGATDDSPGRCPDRYTHLMIAGPPSWSRQRPHDGSRGFQPTGGIIQMRLRRGATLETGGSDPGPPHQASRRDAMTSRPLNRGLKPTATFAESLRDRERPTYDPYHEGNYSPRFVYNSTLSIG
jgi:hypothetical protein